MNDKFETLAEICRHEAKELLNDKKYDKRLKWELEEIRVKGKAPYFLDLHERKVRYPSNQNNLLVCSLLGICEDFSIDQDPNCVYGEYPDIDVDYIPVVREYLKTVWAAETFGYEFVCNIGNYTTFGIKSALIDMARVHGESREEVQTLTKNLEAKDDEGKSLTWDAAMKLYPELKKYCEAHPEVTGAARRLINRNRGMGVHAGGLIIASRPLHDLVPLVKRKDNPQASAWVEGLHGKDLQPVGLVKFDLLVISNLLQIARCCEMVKKRHNLVGICAKPDQPDWSDVEAWRNDNLSLAMANSGDLKCVFQFDKETVRAMARAGGVDRFEDLVAYTSLNRPGPLGMKMQERYIERKKGREQFTQHPLVKPILEKTYGVLCYQEQVMRMLNVVGEIPLYDCELVRKAISAKKLEGFIKYKEKFIINGQKNLGVSEAEITHLWSQIESFAEYGFNLSVSIGTLISTRSYGKLTTKKIEDFVSGDIVFCVNQRGETVETEVVNLHNHGILQGYKVTFDDGYEVTCTLNHKFLTEKGQISLREIIGNNYNILCDPNFTQNKDSEYAKEKCKWMDGSLRSDIPNSSYDVGSLQKLCGMSGEEFYNRGMVCSVWAEFQNKNISQETSAKLCGMSEVGMEVGRSGRTANSHTTHLPLWFEIRNISSVDSTSTGVFCLCKYQTNEYYCQELETESIRESTRSFFQYCSDNFSTTGNTEGPCREFKVVAGIQPGEICEEYRVCMEGFQKVKNGNLVATSIGVGYVSNSLWRRSKTGRFCEGQNLDRSGQILSFQRKSTQEFTPVILRSKSRCNVERRGETERRRDVSSFEHGMFCEFNRNNEDRMLELASKHAQISDTRRLVRRRIVRILPMGKQQMYDLEVSNPTHNFLLPNGVVTSNSHAVAYTYISSWLLYLKAHYSHEFYASILSCETLSEKIKEYKMEAKIHGVDVHRLDINKSGVNFELHGDTIYYGMSNIKGIGEAPAKRIIASQPYKSFEDFLYRFGTDASVLKPLLGLRCFRDRDPVTLWKFAEHFKDYQKKIDYKKKRYALSLIKYDKEFKELFPEEKRILNSFSGDNPFEADEWKIYDIDEFDEDGERKVECRKDDVGAIERWVEVLDEIEGTDLMVERDVIKYFKKDKIKKTWNRWKALKTLWKKRKQSIAKNENASVSSLPKLMGFDSSSWDIPEELAKEFSSPVACEEKYYGFAWIHELERSPDYRGNLTFSMLKNESDVASGPVEMKVLKVSQIKGKKVIYHQMIAEDVNGQQNKINIWEEDWNWWSSVFVVGKLLRLKLQAPTGGFNSFSLEPNQIGVRRGYKRYRTKDDDIRVIVYEHGKKEEEKFLTDEEALAQFSNCIMEQT